MALKTPFLKFFGPLLFGRAKVAAELSRLQNLQSLESLYAVFDGLFPAHLLDPAAQGPGSRRRLLPSGVIFWAFVSQVLSPKSSCREVVRQVEAWWSSTLRHTVSVTPAAYCRARQRLELHTLREINRKIAQSLERRVLRAEQVLPGRDVKIIDGTNINLADTPANQARWPQPQSQKPGCGFPKLKMAALFSLASGALLEDEIGTQTTSEAALFRRLWSRLNPGDVILSDRLFCTYEILASLAGRGVDTVARLHQKRKLDLSGAERLGPDDHLVVWTRPKTCPDSMNPTDFAALPRQMKVRIIRSVIEAKGFRTREVTLATTLLDAQKYPADTLRQLYFQRWEIELHFAQIKTTLKMDELRCQSPAMVEKELLIHLITYNLVRALMQKAAHNHDVPLGRLSFKGSLDALRQAAPGIHASGKQPRKQDDLIDALLTTIAKDIVLARPGREEPRARKRRPKNYQLLTKPRRQMKVIPHREKYRAPVPNAP